MTRPRVLDAALHWGVKACLGIVSRLPPALAVALARRAGDAAHVLARRRRHIARRNLDIAFGASMSNREKGRIVRESFRSSLAGLAGLALRERWIGSGDLDRTFRIAPGDEALLLAPRPRGLAILTAHAGDWEMGHHYLLLLGIPVAAVARRVTNTRVDALLTDLRSRRGGRVIPKEGALSGIAAALGRGEAVALLADQNCPRRRTFLEFLGVRASTYTEYARVLARAEARIVFMTCLREGRGLQFRLSVRDLGSGLPEPQGAGRKERIRARAEEIVRRYLAACEDVIRERPEQYLWIHRRWKSRPDGAPWLYHDLGRPLDPRLLEGERGP